MTAAPKIQLALEPGFRIGAVEVRPAACEVAGPVGVVRAEPRTLQVLILLARHRGAVVPRQAIVDACWDGRIVGDDAINRAILKLRRLARSAGGAFEIQTLPKIGYRLTETAGEAGEPPAPTSSPTPGRRAWLIGGGALIAVGAVGAGLWRTRGPDNARLQAQALFARGEAAFQQGARADNAQAVSFFEQAARLAPNDGRILAALALAYRFEQSFLPVADMAAATARADRATARALAVAPQAPDAIAAQSLYLPFRDHWFETEQRMLAGLPRAPSSGVLHGFHGMLLSDVGRTRAAVAEFAVAAKLEGFVPILRRYLVRALFADGQTVAALQQLDAARALWPEHADLWWLRFWLPALTGDTASARAHLAARETWPAEVTDAQRAAAGLSADALDSASHADAARALAAWRPEILKARGLAPDVAGFAAAVGARDEAFAIAGGFLAPFAHPQGQRLTTPAFLFSPPFAALRADRRLHDLFSLTRLDLYWQAANTRPDLG